MHRIAVPLYKLGIWDFSRLADEAGRYMIDGNALPLPLNALASDAKSVLKSSP